MKCSPIILYRAKMSGRQFSHLSRMWMYDTPNSSRRSTYIHVELPARGRSLGFRRSYWVALWPRIENWNSHWPSGIPLRSPRRLSWSKCPLRFAEAGRKCSLPDSRCWPGLLPYSDKVWLRSTTSRIRRLNDSIIPQRTPTQVRRHLQKHRRQYTIVASEKALSIGE